MVNFLLHDFTSINYFKNQMQGWLQAKMEKPHFRYAEIEILEIHTGRDF